MNDNSIFGPLKRAEEMATRRYHQGLIIQPGALGDCVLTLPLATFMKDALRLQSLDIIGHSEHIVMFPGRTCITKIRSIEAIPLHRLFSDSKSFDLEEHDPLIAAFAPYEWIITFLGGEDTDFERNLIYTANCSSGTEVVSLELKAPELFTGHVSEYYIRQFAERCDCGDRNTAFDMSCKHITPMYADIERGSAILAENGLEGDKIVVIQPGSGGAKKNWPIEAFASVASIIKENGLQVVFLLGPAESSRLNADTIAALADTGKCISGLSISEVIALLSQADAFLGNDSGITHLAASMGVPTTAIFGPTSPVVFRPIGPRVTIFEIPASQFTSVDIELIQNLASHILAVAGR